MLNSFNINNMAYNLYDEYLERYYENALKYANLSGLSIRYFHINLDDSKNLEYETAIRTSLKNYKYDLYEFIPVIDMNPPVQQIFIDRSMQGLSYTATFILTIIGVQNPLPGDLFTFYDISGQNFIDKTEIFRVKHVNYIRSMNKRIPIYQIGAEYAPLKNESLEEIINTNIIKHYYFNSDLGNYIEEDKLPYFEYLTENIDQFGSELDNIYNKINSSYNYCKFNSVIKFLQKNYRAKFKPIANQYLSYNEFNINDFLLAFDKLTYYINKYAERDEVTESEQKLYNDLEKVGELNPIIGSNSDPNSENFGQENQVEVQDDQNNTIISVTEKINIGSKIDTNDLVIFSDLNCETNENEIIFLYNIDTNELFIHPRYQYYLDLYKIVICYRETDPDFYNKLKLTNENVSEIAPNTSIYYSYLGELDSEFYKNYLHINYDPGYYISYQDGVVKYSLITPEQDAG